MHCPCGSEQKYEACCEPFIKGTAFPETAEKLMRSRYTAHVKAEVEYIKMTMIPESRHEFDPVATRAWAKESTWKGLKIESTEKGGHGDAKGTVEFVATYERNGHGVEHHEVSKFKKGKDGHWLFVDGEAHEHEEGHGHDHPKMEPVKREGAKIGRNDACPCGSGKKYKKCCDAAA